MHNSIRKLLIFAAVDGIVLQPAPSKNHKPATEQAIKIAYKGNGIGPLLKDKIQEETAHQALEAHGIVGLLKVASSSFIISISRKEQVALIRGKPVYSISEVALIPLSSQEDAEKAIIRARSSQQRHSQSKEDLLTDSSDEENITLPDDSSAPDPDLTLETSRIGEVKDKATTIAQDVIAKKGLYGRFTDRWFSQKGWTAEQRRKQGLSSEEDLQRVKGSTKDPAFLSNDSESQDESAPTEESDANLNLNRDQLAPAEVAHVIESSSGSQIALLPKILTTTKIFFGSRNFFFSHDYDLSRSSSHQSEPYTSQSLHRTFDPMYYWNKHLVRPFIDSGQEDFTVPLIQGFVGQREFTIDMPSDTKETVDDKTEVQDFVLAQEGSSTEEDSAALKLSQQDSSNSKRFFVTLISRRSVQRAGLRYLRRGIDEEGFVANSVETEQILCSSSWGSDSEKLYSYLQYRGSIPLFFSQSPYSLKPIPVFRGSPESNFAAFKLHFKRLSDRYGQVQVASLVEKKGNEGSVGNLYETLVEKFNKSSNGKDMSIWFEWFDFHAVCKGMRFENVSILFDTLNNALSSFGWTEKIDSKVSKCQTGILRTNCMDCLDRTNVVQSACGRIVLENQLLEQEITIDLQKDANTSWFNTLWADNGDAISRQYAGTAALKGDFTRTRRRNISGALTDFGLTLSRYYNNIVNDYFTQALIDFGLGRADESIFIDFEADMKAQDYAIDLRKVRQNAIETCATICIEETNESLIAGWVLRCPRISGTLRSAPFEECVLLLTEEALYFCRMDWSVEKTKSFEKIDLDAVEGLTRGTYITSTFASRDLDETKNVGFIVKYSTRGKDMVRTNTRSLTSEGESAQDLGPGEKKSSKASSSTKFLAFKALPPRSSYVESNGNDNPPNEVELTQSICEQLARMVNTRNSGSMAREVPIGASSSENEEDARNLLKVDEEDIISLSEAKRSTGYLETMSHVLKKLVWA